MIINICERNVDELGQTITTKLHLRLAFSINRQTITTFHLRLEFSINSFLRNY